MGTSPSLPNPAISLILKSKTTIEEQGIALCTLSRDPLFHIKLSNSNDIERAILDEVGDYHITEDYRNVQLIQHMRNLRRLCYRSYPVDMSELCKVINDMNSVKALFYNQLHCYYFIGLGLNDYTADSILGQNAGVIVWHTNKGSIKVSKNEAGTQQMAHELF